MRSWRGRASSSPHQNWRLCHLYIHLCGLEASFLSLSTKTGHLCGFKKSLCCLQAASAPEGDSTLHRHSTKTKPAAQPVPPAYSSPQVPNLPSSGAVNPTPEQVRCKLLWFLINLYVCRRYALIDGAALYDWTNLWVEESSLCFCFLINDIWTSCCSLLNNEWGKLYLQSIWWKSKPF